METTKNKLFVTCDEAKHICDKNQYGEANFMEIIKLNIRFLYCKITRAYVRRNIKLTKAIKNSNTQIIDSTIKNKMKANLNKELSK